MAANNDWWQKGLNMFVRLSAWIAAPVLLGVLIGRFLDKKFNSEPWLFLATVGLAFVVSMFGLIKEAATEFKKISEVKPGDENKTKSQTK